MAERLPADKPNREDRSAVMARNGMGLKVR
jgi:hypothetical protein